MFWFFACVCTTFQMTLLRWHKLFREGLKRFSKFFPLSNKFYLSGVRKEIFLYFFLQNRESLSSTFLRYREGFILFFFKLLVSLILFVFSLSCSLIRSRKIFFHPLFKGWKKNSIVIKKFVRIRKKKKEMSAERRRRV